MQHADDQQATTPMPEDQRRADPEVRLDDAQEASGGGLPYQQARREPGGSDARPSDADPESQRRTDDGSGPTPDDESWLQDQGYPKLGRKLQSKVTQHEHGPYAGGTQQGDAETREKATARPND